jgi:hypothetical protein
MQSDKLLAQLEARGFSLAVEGAGLKVIPASRLTATDRTAILEHKGELRTLLQHPELGPDERERFEERASIVEYMGKLSRAEAEEMALAEVLAARKESRSTGLVCLGSVGCASARLPRMW